MPGANIPTGAAFAETNNPVNNYIPKMTETGNFQIDEFNRHSLQKWAEAVEEALANGEEIVTVNNPPQDYPSPQSYHIAYAHRDEVLEYAFTDHIVFTASGDVTTANKWASVAGCGGYVTLGMYDFTINTYSYTKIDNGRTLAVNFTAYIVYGGVLHHTTTRHYYVEFYTTGDGWVSVV